MAKILWPLAVVVFSGCPCDPLSAECGEPLEVRVGTGATGFTELFDGDRLMMVHGSQGGWHVDVSAYVTNTAQEVSLEMTLRVVDLDVVIAGEDQETFVALVDYDDVARTGEVWGVQAFIDDVEPVNLQRICGMHGKEADLSVTVANFDSDQQSTATVRVVLAASQQDLSDCGS